MASYGGYYLCAVCLDLAGICSTCRSTHFSPLSACCYILCKHACLCSRQIFRIARHTATFADCNGREYHRGMTLYGGRKKVHVDGNNLIRVYAAIRTYVPCMVFTQRAIDQCMPRYKQTCESIVYSTIYTLYGVYTRRDEDPLHTTMN